MTADEMIRILMVAGKLKTTMRHCYTMEGRKESVADHSWRITLMAMMLRMEPEFADTDMDRVIRMCLIHDLGEAFTGDIPSFNKTDMLEAAEADIYKEWVNTFPEGQRKEWLALLEEMEALKTKEAKTYKALDKLEAVLSHDESDISTWLPLEYDLQLTYGKENVAFSEYLTKLSQTIDVLTREKIASSHSEEA